jgi:transposase
VARRKAEKKPPAPHGRRDLSTEDLPVETIVLEPPERLLPGGEALEKIGEEVSEQIDRRPASFVRVRVVRPKYKLPAVETGAQAKSASIVIAPLPERPIPRGIAGPGLLAHVLVSKYADHLPLHRQERIFRREGVHLPRSTLCGFVQGSVVLLAHVVEAMWEDARRTRAGSVSKRRRRRSARAHRPHRHRQVARSRARVDEIWKSSSAILNSLLTLVNERVFHNDGQPISCPLVTMFGASNELPEGKDLEALFDRFLLRFEVGYLLRPSNLRLVLTSPDSTAAPMMKMADLRKAQAEGSRRSPSPTRPSTRSSRSATPARPRASSPATDDGRRRSCLCKRLLTWRGRRTHPPKT